MTEEMLIRHLPVVFLMPNPVPLKTGQVLENLDEKDECSANFRQKGFYLIRIHWIGRMDMPWVPEKAATKCNQVPGEREAVQKA